MHVLGLSWPLFFRHFCYTVGAFSLLLALGCNSVLGLSNLREALGDSGVADTGVECNTNADCLSAGLVYCDVSRHLCGSCAPATGCTSGGQICTIGPDLRYACYAPCSISSSCPGYDGGTPIICCNQLCLDTTPYGGQCPPTSGLAYPVEVAILPLGITITPIVPAQLGVKFTGYTINPALPSGLSFSNATGTISGTPTAESISTNYTIVEVGQTDAATVISLGVRNFGNGSSGALVVDGGSVVVNTVASRLSASLASGAKLVTLSSTVGFNAAGGDVVLLIQMQNVVSSGSLPWEFVTTALATATTLTFTTATVNSYSVGTGAAYAVAQAVLVPQYTNVTVNSSAILTGNAWSSSAGTGGVLAMYVNGSLSINSGALVSMNGLGFMGGAPLSGNNGNATASQGESWPGPGVASTTAANGGGGGGAFASYAGGPSNAPGGPAGYATDGGASTAQYLGAVGGASGAAYGTANFTPSSGGVSSIALGSGGGGSAHTETSCTTVPGGAGGGIIVLYAVKLSVAGGIQANGAAGIKGECGDESGSGSGGSIYLRTSSMSIGTGLVTASGGPAGTSTQSLDQAASYGRIQLDYATLSGTTTPAAGFTRTGVGIY